MLYPERWNELSEVTYRSISIEWTICLSISESIREKWKFQLKIRIDIVNDKNFPDTETSFAIGNLTVTDRSGHVLACTPFPHSYITPVFPSPPTTVHWLHPLDRCYFYIHFVKIFLKGYFGVLSNTMVDLIWLTMLEVNYWMDQGYFSFILWFLD